MGYLPSLPIWPMYSSATSDRRRTPPAMTMIWPPNHFFAALSGPAMVMLWPRRPSSARSDTVRVTPPTVFAVPVDTCRWLNAPLTVTVFPSADTDDAVARSLWFTSRSDEATTIRSPADHDTGSVVVNV